jgi:transposase
VEAGERKNLPEAQRRQARVQVHSRGCRSDRLTTGQQPARRTPGRTDHQSRLGHGVALETHQRVAGPRWPEEKGKKERAPSRGPADKSGLGCFIPPFLLNFCVRHFARVWFVQEENARATYNQLRQAFWHEMGDDSLPLSNGTIYRLLKQGNFTTKTLRKEPEGRNSESTMARRVVYCQEMSEEKEEYLVFIDESGFDLHTNRKRGRARVGRSATVITSNSKGGNITLCLALSPTRGVIHYKVKHGSMKGEDYTEFIVELLKLPAFQTTCHSIVQDNCSIHKTDDVAAAFTNTVKQHKQVFLPPYSPQLNPCEYAFNKIKAYVKRHEKHSRTQLISLIHKAVATVTATDALGWCREVMRWYIRGALHEKF